MKFLHALCLMALICVASASIEDYVPCPDGRYCPNGTTCCVTTNGAFGCCPYQFAMCCSDHIHCCPEGYRCVISQGSCSRSTLSGEEFIPIGKKFQATSTPAP